MAEFYSIKWLVIDKVTDIVLIGLIGFFIKAIISDTVNRNLEAFKSKLAIDSYKTTTIYNEQVKIVREIYLRLSKLKNISDRLNEEIYKATSANSYFSKMPVDEIAAKLNITVVELLAKMKLLSNTYVDFHGYYHENCIYLPNDLVELIDNYVKISPEKDFNILNITDYNKYVKSKDYLQEILIHFKYLLGITPLNYIGNKPIKRNIFDWFRK